MGTLTDPLEPAEQKLVDIVWPLFAKHHEYPLYDYVDYHMRRAGFDAAEVINNLPSLTQRGYRGTYKAVDFTSGGGLPQAGSVVYLTMAGLYHLRDDEQAQRIIIGVLAYMRALVAARDQIGKEPFKVVSVDVSLQKVRELVGIAEGDLPWIAAIAEHEWPAMSVTREQDADSVSGRLSFIRDDPGPTIEGYLDAITVAVGTQTTTVAPVYRDPDALPRAITNFDITCELVLKRRLVRKPALTRTVLFGQDAVTHTDYQAGVSALGELLGDLDVPGKNPSHATGRLLGYLEAELPSIDQVRVQTALDLMDAVRHVRNSGVHPKPSEQLIKAHTLLGLPLSISDPTTAWDTVRAQMDVAFTTLQEEIYAAHPHQP